MMIKDVVEKTPTKCCNCDDTLVKDVDKDLYCPNDCYVFYSVAKERWYNY